MNRFRKYGLPLFAAFFALIAVVFFLGDYLAQRYKVKARIIESVAIKTHRALTFDDQVDLHFLPHLGIRVRNISVSEKDLATPFAAINQADFYISWSALIKGTVEVNRLLLDGVGATLIRYKDGTTNIDDFLKKSEPGLVRFNLRGLEIDGATLRLHDERSNNDWVIREGFLKTGPLIDRVPTTLQVRTLLFAQRPAMDARVQLSGDMLFDSDAKHYEIKRLKGSLDGKALNMQQLKVGLEAEQLSAVGDDWRLRNFNAVFSGIFAGQAHNANSFNGTLVIPAAIADRKFIAINNMTTLSKLNGKETSLDFKADIKGFKASEGWGIEAISATIDGQAKDAKIIGRYATKLSKRPAGELRLENGVGAFRMSHGMFKTGELVFNTRDNIRLNLREQTIDANINGAIPGSHMKSHIRLRSFDKPQIHLDADIDALDLDALLATPRPARKPDNAKEGSSFDELFITGLVEIGTLKYKDIVSSRVQLTIKEIPDAK